MTENIYDYNQNNSGIKNQFDFNDSYDNIQFQNDNGIQSYLSQIQNEDFNKQQQQIQQIKDQYQLQDENNQKLQEKNETLRTSKFFDNVLQSKQESLQQEPYQVYDQTALVKIRKKLMFQTNEKNEQEKNGDEQKQRQVKNKLKIQNSQNLLQSQDDQNDDINQYNQELQKQLEKFQSKYSQNNSKVQPNSMKKNDQQPKSSINLGQLPQEQQQQQEAQKQDEQILKEQSKSLHIDTNYGQNGNSYSINDENNRGLELADQQKNQQNYNQKEFIEKNKNVDTRKRLLSADEKQYNKKQDNFGFNNEQ
ncbi:hypothetical protein PPERSA_11665 [Pseudocohnilembus persalinus]|uniref:Uncharacterized protein n=1 Tax=Pseudocohnilembus persalinus TaxID=266149 RepID=A0A0V0QA18_PSEPJ|nr:hypothetical protein PPERSA_11665 [Pseudocohnilembus persalinus]|eukprot:KRW99064.1 hypothetical protein PPERSA_11665 [Pseudocohnilembus persalinus]